MHSHFLFGLQYCQMPVRDYRKQHGEKQYVANQSRTLHACTVLLSNVTVTLSRRSVSIKITVRVCPFDTDSQRWNGLTLMYPYRNRLFNLRFNLLGSTRAWLTLLTRWNTSGKTQEHIVGEKFKQLPVEGNRRVTEKSVWGNSLKM